MARILYLFSTSVFARRTRLALAHKGLDAELRDGREDPEALAEARRLSPQGTMPVLVDDGRVLGDSNAIAHYLDLAYPERPRLWPTGAKAAADALEIASLVDVAMNGLVDLGTRYHVLRNDPAWGEVHRERMGRAQSAIETIAARATTPILAGDAWGAAEIWVLAATRWVQALPERAKTTPIAAQLVSLGFRLPDALVRWAEQHASRPEVRAIYG